MLLSSSREPGNETTGQSVIFFSPKALEMREKRTAGGGPQNDGSLGKGDSGFKYGQFFWYLC